MQKIPKQTLKKLQDSRNILQNQKSKIGEKLPGNTEEKEKAKLNTTLTETNRILVEIQKQLAYDFAMRAAEDKKEVAEDKEATSKERFKREESALEKSAKAMVSTVKTATKKIVSPIGNIFQKLLAFIGILAKGIAVNAAFEWFKDPKNREKITKFFNILKQNWKLLRNILLTVVAAGLVIKVISALTAIGGVLAFLANPVTLTVLATLAGLAAGTYFASKGAKWAINKFQETQYGKGNVKKGVFATKLGDQFGRISKKEDLEKLTPEERADATKISLYDNLLKSRQKTNDALYRARNNTSPDSDTIKQLESELKFKDRSIADAENQTMIKGKSLGDLFNMYSSTGLLPKTSLSERVKGGPVTAKTPYLVGEGGPEIFAPNINGSVINNMRTEKITQMLASGKKGRTRIVELSPQTIEGPKPEIKMPRGPATKAPKISSSNSLDGYRSVSSGIYGIMV